MAWIADHILWLLPECRGENLQRDAEDRNAGYT